MWWWMQKTCRVVVVVALGYDWGWSIGGGCGSCLACGAQCFTGGPSITGRPIPLILLRFGIPDEGRDRLSRVKSFPHKAVTEFVDMHDFLTYK